MTFSSTPVPWRQDVRTIGLVGLAHGTSHFFHLMLPPLFPMFLRDFGLSYADLGLLVTTFFVISGVGQAWSGFWVDRIGARPVLLAALAMFALAAWTTACAQGYAGLVLGAALAGLGNAPFHPVDFTILNQRVSPARLGHAYSVHGISGNLGWALAPVFLMAFASWRMALFAMGAWALCVMAVMWFNREALDDRVGKAVPSASLDDAGPVAPAKVAEHPLAFLKSPSIWQCFSFFFFSTCALTAIQSFAAPALKMMYGLPYASTAFVVTGYMLFGAIGMVLGGFMAARTQRLEHLIGWSLVGSALLLICVGSAVLPGMVAAIVAAVAGLGTGLSGPSRDLLIKRAAPPGATGRVYGMVYSGLDLGFAVAAPIFGMLLDHGLPGGVFYGSALMLVLGVACAAWVGTRLLKAS